MSVTVKPLEWEERTSPREDGPAEGTGDWEGHGILGAQYFVYIFEDHYEVTREDGEYVESHLGDCDEAKAAAQADYESRIRSAISPPSVSSEPVRHADDKWNIYLPGWDQHRLITREEVVAELNLILASGWDAGTEAALRVAIQSVAIPAVTDEKEVPTGAIRICPARDGRCPYGDSCTFAVDRYHCDIEASRDALKSSPAS